MRDLMERFVLLPFTVSESSIPVVKTQHTKRSKLYTDSTPTRTHEKEKEEEYDYVDGEESLWGESLKTAALPRFQKLLKTFSQLLEAEMGLEIGFRTDVSHIGRGSAS